MFAISATRRSAPQSVLPSAAPLAMAPVAVPQAVDELQIGSVGRMLGAKGGVMNALHSDLGRMAIDLGSGGYTAVNLATGHADRIAGGTMPWLTRGLDVVTAVTGVMDLNSELRSTTKRPAWARDLVLAGGYLSTTGSFIGVFGGLLPGAAIAMVGAGIQAVGLVGYALAKHTA